MPQMPPSENVMTDSTIARQTVEHQRQIASTHGNVVPEAQFQLMYTLAVQQLAQDRAFALYVLQRQQQQQQALQAEYQQMAAQRAYQQSMQMQRHKTPPSSSDSCKPHTSRRCYSKHMNTVCKCRCSRMQQFRRRRRRVALVQMGL